MPAQDPIHNFTLHTNTSGHADNILDKLRLAAISAGWVVDEWNTLVAIGTEVSGRELFIHTNDVSFSQQAYFSFKSHMGQGGDHTGIVCYANTGYDSTRRVDNQPGMYARHGNDVVNAAPWTEVFSGLWDGVGGVNSDPLDHSKYQTPSNFVPSLVTNKAHFNCKNSGTFDKVWFIVDTTARVLVAVWYLDNILECLVMGKVYYDDEGTAPSNVDGHLLAGWNCKYDDRLTLNLPINNSLGGERSSPAADEYPFVVIRNRTNGGIQFPVGTPNGTPFFGCGTVVKSYDRIEASDNFNQANSSQSHRPDQAFDQTYNHFQAPLWPNPKITIHYEALSTSQHRQLVCRHRRISRWPNGGALVGANYAGQGSVDWADSRYSFPWYFVPTAGLQPGDIIANAHRRYLVFPGNRGGVDPFAAHRYAGIGFRLTDI